MVNMMTRGDKLRNPCQHPEVFLPPPTRAGTASHSQNNKIKGGVRDPIAAPEKDQAAYKTALQYLPSLKADNHCYRTLHHDGHPAPTP